MANDNSSLHAQIVSNCPNLSKQYTKVKGGDASPKMGNFIALYLRHQRIKPVDYIPRLIIEMN
ncbi:hypothetical protein N7453_004151 [Penicillium expansum]|nr:hypothetical protein N7453_004151 [Penicillium expansum]